MGSGSSGVYRGTHGSSKAISSIKDNLTSSFKKDYGFTDGLFGTASKNKNAGVDVRNIVSKNPLKTARDFYGKLTKGGIEKSIPPNKTKGKGEMHVVNMADGSTITFRAISTSDGSPAVDINIRRSTEKSGIKSQKIHFIGE